MKRTMKNILRADPVLILVTILLMGCYIYFCFAYNLQFYTEDERYVQLDMTNLVSLYQWEMTNYRVSSSLGCFLYYPLNDVLEIASKALTALSGGDKSLIIVPMMLSKLVHSVLVFFGWLWFSIAVGRFLSKQFGITAWTGFLCLLFTAMLPINIFLVKTNNYDSIYAILCLLAGLHYLKYALSGRIRELIVAFFLFALAMQEKFAAYPLFMAAFVFAPFLIRTGHFSSSMKDVLAVITGIIAGSILPSILRGMAELFWAPDASVFLRHLSDYQPFLTFPKALGTASHFLEMNSSMSYVIVKHAFALHMIGFSVWAVIIVVTRKKFDLSQLMCKPNIWIGLGGGLQVLFLLWAFASFWYSVPPSGTYPFDTPPPGTYLPPHLSDSNPTFYYGANHAKYIFIRLMETMGFFKAKVYSPILILLLLGPIFTFGCIKLQPGTARSMALTSSGVFCLTMMLVLLVNLIGVPFGGRYANIYLTLLGLSGFLTMMSFVTLPFWKNRINDQRMLPLAIACFLVLFSLELRPYGPSFQVFGNWFYPIKGCGGWGEPTSALIQAARTDPFLKQAIGRTLTTYTGLGIEHPFFTPLINLRLIHSRAEGTAGKRRDIQYLLIELTAMGQGKVLKNLLNAAEQIEGAIVWKWECNGAASAWLVDLRKLGLDNYEDRIDPGKFERHYRGEWFF